MPKINWRNYIDIDASVPPKERSLIEAVLDYETKDRNNDGKIDNLKTEQLFQELKNSFTGTKIHITSNPEGNQARLNNLNIDLDEIKKVGTVNTKDMTLIPFTLNAALMHELAHCVRYVAYEKNHPGTFKKHKDSFLTATLELIPDLYEDERKSTEFENSIRQKSNWPLREKYALTLNLEKELNEVICITSDNQKYENIVKDVKKVKLEQLLNEIKKNQDTIDWNINFVKGKNESTDPYLKVLNRETDSKEKYILDLKTTLNSFLKMQHLDQDKHAQDSLNIHNLQLKPSIEGTKAAPDSLRK